MSLTPHGGDIQTFVERFGRAPLDYSANTNPLGISPAAKAAISDVLDDAHRYPDPYCRQLREALSEKEQVPAEYIVCGNGAADLIFRLVMAVRPHRALLLAPTFSEYEESLIQCGCECEHYFLFEERNFMLDEGILERISSDIDILFLCEPNNPTGACSSPALLERIAARCQETKTLLVIDECFNGFLTQPARQSLVHFLPTMPQLVILKAFTKLYGMAGLRLGYLLCSDEALIARIGKVGQHWAVSSLAQAGGCGALTEEEWLQETRDIIAGERPRLQKALEDFGCKVFDSDANYVLFYSPDHELDSTLAQEGILIRNCSNYRGLTAGYFRIAVKTAQENTKFIHALLQIKER